MAILGLPALVAAGNRYILFLGTDAAINTWTGAFVMQAGSGSEDTVEPLNLFAHSHATKPGWVTVGISDSAGSGATEGRFTVNNQGLASGTDVFTVLRTGNAGIGTTGPGRSWKCIRQVRQEPLFLCKLSIHRH